MSKPIDRIPTPAHLILGIPLMIVGWIVGLLMLAITLVLQLLCLFGHIVSTTRRVLDRLWDATFGRKR